ncbi:MAG: hypothetical protein RBU37_05785 [Myxococcota bacterium]|jgi:hypothetical protein|nr:hypothetical protein [Myxococcota bacterium]
MQWTTALIVGAMCWCVLLACDRVDVRSVDTPTPMDAPAEASMVLQFSARFFERAAFLQRLGDTATLVWSGGSLQESIDENAEFVLGPLDASWTLEQVAISPEHGGLRVSTQYRSDAIRTSIRVRQGSESTICRIDLEPGLRQLDFLMQAKVVNQSPSWTSETSVAMQALTPLSYEPSEACAFDLSSLDWDTIAQRIDTSLAGQAATLFAPQLSAQIGQLIGLPSGGLLLARTRYGFFDPVDLQLRSAVSGSSVFNGSSFVVEPEHGVRLALDVEPSAVDAPCVEGLSLPVRPAPIPLRTTLAPASPSFDVAILLTADLLQWLLDALIRSGQLCVDTALNAQGMPSLSSELSSIVSLLPEAASLEGFSFGRAGRLLVQALGSPRFLTLVGSTLHVDQVKLRLDVYGLSHELSMRLLRIETELKLELGVSLQAGSLTFSLKGLEVVSSQLEESFSARGLQFDLQALLERAVSGLLKRVQVPVPVPLSQQLRWVEAQQSGSDVFVLLELED